MVRCLLLKYCPEKYPLTPTYPPCTNAPQERITRSVSLIWHPSGEGQTPYRRLPSPVCVDAWFEQEDLGTAQAHVEAHLRPYRMRPPQAGLVLLPPPLPHSPFYRYAQHCAHILPAPNGRSGCTPPGEASQEPLPAMTQRGGGSGGCGEEEGIISIRGP